MKTRYIFILPILISLTSCFTAHPIVVLEANNAVGEWYFGQQVIRMEEEGVELAVSYERESPFEITMNLTITNNTDQNILIDPHKFHYLIYRAEFDTVPASVVVAENPETRLINLDYEISSNEAAQNNRAVFELVATTTEVAADIVSVADKWSEEDKEKLQGAKAVRRGTTELIAAQQKVRSMSLNEQRALWSRQVLRKTTLPPNATIHGKVIYKPRTRAKRCRFVFPIAGSRISIDFKQSIFPNY